MKLLFWVHVRETLNAACLVEYVTLAKQRSSGGGLTFSQCFNSEVQPSDCGSTAVDPKGFHPNFRKPSFLRRAEDVSRTSPLL